MYRLHVLHDWADFGLTVTGDRSRGIESSLIFVDILSTYGVDSSCDLKENA